MNRVRNDLAFYPNKVYQVWNKVFSLRSFSHLAHQNIIQHKFYVIKFYMFLFLSEDSYEELYSTMQFSHLNRFVWFWTYHIVGLPLKTL